jgi:hypothetical protein
MEAERRRCDEQLRELERRKAEIERLRLAKERQMEELPRLIAEREKKEKEARQIRAKQTVTEEGIGRVRDKRHETKLNVSVASRRMTSTEQRAARIHFLVLCAVLATILILLWKSLP